MRSWRITALLEIALFLAGALLLDRYVFAGDRFASVQPHPFWIIILLMAAQYGTGEALLAAVASTAALLIGNIPDQPIDQDIYAYILELARNPILRSEEHTSELQSIMRNSYAVFCLKKNNNTQHTQK